MRIVAWAMAALVAVVAAAVVPPGDGSVPVLASVPVDSTLPAAPAAPAAPPAAAVDDAELILPMALPVDEAVDEVGLAALQAANEHLDAATVAALVTDPMVHVDEAGQFFVVDTGWAGHDHGHDAGHDDGADRVEMAALGVQQSAPVADVFTLESRPGSKRTIFLDFDGATYTGTWWNDSTYPTIVVAPYDSDGDSSFSTLERLFVYEVWAAVAEDFAPFDVNVTTKDPGYDALNRSSADDVFGTVAQIGPKPPAIAALCGPGCLGVAYVGTFDYPWDSAEYQPAWVFPGSSGSALTADIVSHEVGHNLGLRHDGKGASEYYGGHGDWSPIMGNGDGPIDQFSIGDYAGATRTEDDFDVMSSNGLQLMADDFPDTVTAADAQSPVDLSASEVEGLIASRADVDVVKLTLPAGPVTVSASPAVLQPNLDVSLTLLAADGSLVGSADPASGSWLFRSTGMGASVTATLAGGTYFAVVDGVGSGSPLLTGYSDYGSVGRYTLRLGRHLLDVSVVGAGTVSSSPAGISCTSVCSVAMPGSGSQVTLTATPAGGETFVRWTGVCSGSSTCVVDTSQAREVTAVFTGTSTPTTTSTTTTTTTTTLPPTTSTTSTTTTTTLPPTTSTTSTTTTTLPPTTSTTTTTTTTLPPTTTSTTTTTTTTLPPSRVVPSAPTSLRATPGNGQLALTWRAPSRPGDSPISGYEYSLNSGSWVSMASSAVSATSLTGTITGLVNGTSYRVRVRAVNRAGGGWASSTVYATPSTTPSAPVNLTVTPGNGSATVRFTAPSSGGSRITRYEYSLNGGTTWVTRWSTSTTFTVTRLTNGATYSVRVRAVNARGTGPASDAVSVTPRTKPGAPTRVAVVPGNGSLAVTWVAPVSSGGSPITTYQVSTDGGVRWTTITPASTATSTTITGLVNGRSYRVRVRAVNAAGSGSASSSVYATPRTTPGTPTNVRVTPGVRSVSIRFTAPSSGGSRIIRYDYSLDGGTTWVARRSSSTWFSVTGLAAGSTYRVVVRAVNAAGTGPTSNAVAVTSR